MGIFLFGLPYCFDVYFNICFWRVTRNSPFWCFIHNSSHSSQTFLLVTTEYEVSRFNLRFHLPSMEYDLAPLLFSLTNQSLCHVLFYIFRLKEVVSGGNRKPRVLTRTFKHFFLSNAGHSKSASRSRTGMLHCSKYRGTILWIRRGEIFICMKDLRSWSSSTVRFCGPYFTGSNDRPFLLDVKTLFIVTVSAHL